MYTQVGNTPDGPHAAGARWPVLPIALATPAARPARPLVACLVGTAARARLASITSGRADVASCLDRASLVARVRETRAAAVVIDLRDASGRPTTGTVRTLRLMAPSLPLLAWCRLDEPDCRALLDFARAGGSDVLVEGTACAPLLAALEAGTTGAASVASVASLVARLHAEGVPVAFGPLLELFLSCPDDPAAPARAAERLGVSRRALERRLRRASLPSPRVLHGWCRLLVAASRLRGDAVAVERVALDVGFSSANALRNALQRYGGTTPTALRTADGLDALVGRLRGARVAEAPHGRDDTRGGEGRPTGRLVASHAWLLRAIVRAWVAGVGARRRAG